MFNFFNSDSLWIGTDLQKFNLILNALTNANIEYKHKIRNQNGQPNNSIGIPFSQPYQYEIFVYKKNLDQAKFLVKQIHN